MLRFAFLPLLLILAANGSGLGQGRRKEPEPKEYVSETYLYKTNFPEKDPKVTTQKLKTNAGELDQGTASVELRSATYSVTVTELPETTIRNGSKAVFDGVRDGIKGKAGIIQYEKPWDKGPAHMHYREILFDFRKNQLRTRIYLVDNRLYQVTVTGSKSIVTGNTADRFFSAFEITK
ncbi:MAG TPA: hypothetical protein VGJ05_01780 [Fimbriiglobus sp.]